MSTFEIKPVAAELLTVDPRVQRPLDAARVRRLARSWDPRAAGVITVSQRSPERGGASVVLDGQTRLAAFLQLQQENPHAVSEPLTGQVYTGLSEADEALMFLEHNDRKAVTPRDRFRLSVMAGEEWAVRATAVLASRGWYAHGMDAPADRTTFHRYGAVQAVERTYKLDGTGDVLARTVDIVSAAWPTEPEAVRAETLDGIGLLLDRWDGLDTKGLTVKLSKLTLARYLARVNDWRIGHPGKSSRQAAYGFTVDVYNLSRKTHRLDI
jgi:hypothetical protein